MSASNLKSLPAFNLDQLQQWGPKIASALLVVGIASALTQWVWLFTGAATAPVAVETAPVEIQQGPPEVRGRQLAGEVANLHLFGEAIIDPVQQMIDAPDTRLNLNLIGILAIGEKEGLAIISSGGGAEEVYSIGKQVPGNATLKAVYADRVILESSRGLETLRLPKKSDLFEFSQPEAPEPPQAPASVPSGNESIETLSAYRRELVGNPAMMANMARYFAPEKANGELIGYKLNESDNNPLFGELGLMNNDVITSINGIALNRPENSMRALQRLRRDQKISVTVLRNGQETHIEHELEN